MKKVFFVLTSHDRKGNTGQATGFYLPEAAHPWAQLQEQGIEVDFVSPKGGRPPMDGVDEPIYSSGRVVSHSFCWTTRRCFANACPL